MSMIMIYIPVYIAPVNIHIYHAVIVPPCMFKGIEMRNITHFPLYKCMNIIDPWNLMENNFFFYTILTIFFFKI